MKDYFKYQNRNRQNKKDSAETAWGFDMFLDRRTSARGFGVKIFGLRTLAPGYVLAPMFTRVF